MSGVRIVVEHQGKIFLDMPLVQLLMQLRFQVRHGLIPPDDSTRVITYTEGWVQSEPWPLPEDDTE